MKRWIGLATWTCIVGLGACAGVDDAPEPDGFTTSESTSGPSVPCTLSRAQVLAASGVEARRRVIERGFRWYDADVAYSQTASHEGYRTDCSGFLSMCWTLDRAYTTADFVAGGGRAEVLGSYDDLQPGDALIRRVDGNGHASLFLGWNDSAHTAACVLELASTALDMQFRARPTDDLKSRGTRPYRLSGMPVASAPAPATAPTPRPAPTTAPTPRPAPNPAPVPTVTPRPEPAPPPAPAPRPAPSTTTKPPPPAYPPPTSTTKPPPPPNKVSTPSYDAGSPDAEAPAAEAPQADRADQTPAPTTTPTPPSTPPKGADEEREDDDADEEDERRPDDLRGAVPYAGCSMPGPGGASNTPFAVALALAIARYRRRQAQRASRNAERSLASATASSSA